MKKAVKKKIIIRKKSGSVVLKPNKIADEEIPPEEAVETPDDQTLSNEPEQVNESEAPSDRDAEPESPPQVVESEPEPEPSPPAKEEPVAPEKKEVQLFKFYCVYCGQKLSAQEGMSGRKISCPACGHRIEIPEKPA
jgi:DNA-directed RNA polymerase subunit RPC12/RpoP